MNKKRKNRIRRVKVVRKIFLKDKGGFRKKLFHLKGFTINSLLPLLTNKISLNSRISVLPNNRAFKIVKNQVIIIKMQLNDNFIKYMPMKLLSQITLLKSGMKITTRKNSIRHQKDRIEKKLTLRINNNTILAINHIHGEVTRVWYQVKKTNHSAR